MSGPLRVTLSRSAAAALAERTDPLVVELELLFSCLIRKRTLFPGSPPGDGTALYSDEPRLAVYFRPVVTAQCRIDETGPAAPLTALPLERGDAFRPRWLHVGYRGDEWVGEFGYAPRR